MHPFDSRSPNFVCVLYCSHHHCNLSSDEVYYVTNGIVFRSGLLMHASPQHIDGRLLPV